MTLNLRQRAQPGTFERLLQDGCFHLHLRGILCVLVVTSTALSEVWTRWLDTVFRILQHLQKRGFLKVLFVLLNLDLGQFAW
ncbi:hypothetical protein RBB78_02030 [Tunturiibacter empetritectus]